MLSQSAALLRCCCDSNACSLYFVINICQAHGCDCCWVCVCFAFACEGAVACICVAIAALVMKVDVRYARKFMDLLSPAGMWCLP